MNIILLGPPGSGKGTQSKLIQEKYNLSQLSTGDLVRAEIKSESDLGLQIKSAVDSGKFPSDDIIINLVKKQIEKSTENYIFDGFPRTLVQANKLDEMLNELGHRLGAVIALSVDQDILIKRIVGRYMCAQCGAIYNDYFNPTQEHEKCDECGSAKFTRRSDDTHEAVSNRLELYKTETEPLIDYYDTRGLLTQINGLNDPNVVFEQIGGILENAEVSHIS